jgi:mRNA interferase RelE/StbE
MPPHGTRYNLEYGTAAARQLSKLDRPIALRIKDALERLRDNPRGPGCKSLVGEHNYWRLRVGDHRVVYDIQDDVLVIVVVAIAHRREVYRGV